MRLRCWFLLVLLLLSGGLRADDGAPLPYLRSQRGYHVPTLELARACLDQGLVSECRKLCATVQEEAKGAKEAEAAAALLKEIPAEKIDAYSAKSWGAYLDQREALVVRRGAAAFAKLGANGALIVLGADPNNADARKALGEEWVGGVGWCKRAEAERLKPLCIKAADAVEKAPYDATWEKPYILVGLHFTLVTDLPWPRALKYSRLLERYHAVFVEKMGDVVPTRSQPNVVYCCRMSKTFVDYSAKCGLDFTDQHSGMYVQHIGVPVINAERCDYVGQKNGSKDNLARTLYHECTHRLIDVGLRGSGDEERWATIGSKEHAWIVEAAAIVFEGLEMGDKGYELKGLEFQRTYTINKYFRPKKQVPDAKSIMLQGYFEFAAETPVSSAQKYAVAGSIGWYCLFHKPKEYRMAFLGLMVDYYRGDTACRDFKARFGTDIEPFVKEWTEYVLK
ncbi:MAG: hypothetical protein IT462_06435 [Planctomycetes bacterium]|nr:hypothetical protein [Planctomycetota bacterium]